jgi:hypothetical protein
VARIRDEAALALMNHAVVDPLNQVDDVSIEVFGRRQLGAERLAALSGVIPDDHLREKRRRNLSRAERIVVASAGLQPVGVVFMRRIAGIPNVTWMVVPAARRRGIALRLLQGLQDDTRWLTAICRNEASVAVARKAGFRLAFGRFAVWVGRGRR